MTRSAWLSLTLIVVLGACSPADGPRPVALDRTTCAHCRMIVSDLAFAAQVETSAGEVLDFDDPGCLLRWRAQHAVDARAVWYHHVREERWLREAEAGFVEVEATPMEYGLGAVDATTPGALNLADAEAHVARGQARLRE